MPRPILDEAQIHPAVRAAVARGHIGVVEAVQRAAATHAVLVVGMAGNPFCRRARKQLDAAAVPHDYLEYGSYFSGWRQRNALKMWTGWPTFPMVFVRGTLIGGADDLRRLMDSGALPGLISGG